MVELKVEEVLERVESECVCECACNMGGRKETAWESSRYIYSKERRPAPRKGLGSGCMVLWGVRV